MYSGTPRTLKCIVGALLLACCGLSCAASDAAKPHYARLSLLSEHTSAAPGSAQWVGLRFQIDPGWHIYWTNPGDSGEPPKIAWHLPDGVQAGELQFPAPQRIQDHGLVDYGYEGDVVLLSKITFPQSGTLTKAEIAADVKYLVCREVCVPAKDHVALTMQVDKSAKPSPEADLIRASQARLPESLPERVHVSATQDHDSFLISVTGKPANFGAAKDFIPAEAQLIENTAKPVVQESSTSSSVRLKKSEQLNHPVQQLRGLLIAGNKAYSIAMPVTSAKNSRQRSSIHKTVSQKNQAAKKAKE